MARTGAPKKYDWRDLHKKWELTLGVTLREWTEANNLSYFSTCKAFSTIDREHEERLIQLAKRRLARTAPDAAEKIGKLLDSQDDNVSLRASIANLGMVGISQQAVANQAQVNVQINMPSMFANDDNQEDLRQLLQGHATIEGKSD